VPDLDGMEIILEGQRMNWFRWRRWCFGWCNSFKCSFKDNDGTCWIHLFWSLFIQAEFFALPFVKFLRGFRVLRKTNVPKSILLFAYHHPDSLTWAFNSWLYWDFKPTRWKLDLWPTNSGWRFFLAAPLFQWTIERQIEIMKDETPVLLEKARKARRRKFVRKSWGKNYYQDKARKDVAMSEIDKLIAAEKLKFDQETGANVVDMKSRIRH
jgi:hypothetical protein